MRTEVETIVKISLKPETERAIAEKLKGDRYSTADEVVWEALQLLTERDRLLDQHKPIKNMEEFEAMVKQLIEKFEACIKPDVPILSDYAVSRAGIYEEHP